MFQNKKNIIAGRNPVVEALTNGQSLDKILMFRNATGEAIQEIRRMAREAGVPIQHVPAEKLNALTAVLHQGVVAYKSTVLYYDLEQIIEWVQAENKVPLFIMLDGVTDVRNIGAIARSALCCGAQALIIPDKGVGALNEDAMKSSAGALDKIQICRVPSLLKAADTLRMNGISVFTSEMKATVLLYDLNLADPCCIVMGNEEKGVQSYMSKSATERFRIPMAADFDSLNVSVATGMILYEAMKQRLTPLL